MSNVAQAWSTLMTATSKVASTAGNIVGTVDSAVSIASTYVEHNLKKQQLRQAIASVYDQNHLEEDAALHMSERRLELNKRLKDPEFAEIFAKSISEIRAVTRPSTSAT